MSHGRIKFKDNRYWVFMSVKDEASQHLDEKPLKRMRNLGMQASLEGQYRCNYYGILAENEIKEKMGYEKLEETGNIRNGRSNYLIVSAGYDSVCFDSNEEGRTAKR